MSPENPKNSTFLAEIDGLPDGPPQGISPRSATIDVTHECPFRCPGCIEQDAMVGSGRSGLLLNTVCRFMRQFAERGGCEVCLYGGEPTAHPEFAAIVSCAATCLQRIRVATNGAFLSKNAIATSLREAATRTEVTVRVSLNAGMPKTHGLLHGVWGFYDQVIAGMKALKGSPVRLEVSFLLEQANADEIERAYEVAAKVGAQAFWPRPKTGPHGIGLVPLAPGDRKIVLDAIDGVGDEAASPAISLPLWYRQYLETGQPPNTAKPYPACFYCAASRLVISPPEPGVVWSCTFWRGVPGFHVANLGEIPYDSEEFERRRIEAIRRVLPARHCAGVICNRNQANREIWARLRPGLATREKSTQDVWQVACDPAQ